MSSPLVASGSLRARGRTTNSVIDRHNQTHAATHNICGLRLRSLHSQKTMSGRPTQFASKTGVGTITGLFMCSNSNGGVHLFIVFTCYVCLCLRLCAYTIAAIVQSLQKKDPLLSRQYRRRAPRLASCAAIAAIAIVPSSTTVCHTHVHTHLCLPQEHEFRVDIGIGMCMYVCIHIYVKDSSAPAHTPVRARAHTGPRRHATELRRVTDTTSNAHAARGLSAGRHFTQTTIGSPSALVCVRTWTWSTKGGRVGGGGSSNFLGLELEPAARLGLLVVRFSWFGVCLCLIGD